MGKFNSAPLIGILTILLLSAIIFCLWKLYNQHQIQENSYMTTKYKLLNEKKLMDEQIQYLESLLILEPCEAKTKYSNSR